MPSCRVTNNTPQPLNICLKQVTALHFENGVQPGQTIKLKPGKVWFSLEAIVDDGTKKSRYSILKSAATIALLSIAVGAVAATAGAAMLPAGVAAGGTAAAGYMAKGLTLTKGALIKNTGTIAKISSMALPKAIEKISTEMGGLTALQREVGSIIASPTLSSDVRHKATGLLRQLYTAYSTDKETAKSQGGAQPVEGEVKHATLSNPHPNGPQAQAQARTNPAAGTSTSTNPPTYNESETVPHFNPPHNPSIPPETSQEAAALESELDNNKWDDRVEDTPVSSESVLRVHGIYMNTRRHLEVRVDHAGNLVLWDSGEGKLWGM